LRDARIDLVLARIEKNPEVINEVIRNIDSDIRSIRFNSIYVLGELGDKSGKDAVGKITYCLEDNDWSICREAARSLGKIGGLAEDAVSSLKNLTSNQELSVRIAAIQALGKIGKASPESIQALRTALKDSNEEVRAEAAQSLGLLGPNAFTAIQDLMYSLKDANWNVRTQSAQAISNIGKNSAEAIPTLINALGDNDWRVRYRVVNTLAQIGEASIPYLLETLNNKEIKRKSKFGNVNKVTNLGLNIFLLILSPIAYIISMIFLFLNIFLNGDFFYFWVYSSIVTMIIFTLGVLTYIIGILIKNRNILTKSTIDALGELKIPDPEVIKQLSMMLKDRDEAIRGKAADSLRSLGEKSVEALVNALTDVGTKTKILIITALGGIGAEAKDCIPHLSNMLIESNINTKVRVEIVRTLGNIGVYSDETRSSLITALTDPKSIVRRAAALSLGKFGQKAIDTVPHLLKALQDKNPDVRWRSSEALGKIKLNTTEIIDSLKSLIHDECDYVCESADVAIDNITNTETI
jgi:HEAT repeat protein